jgi:hypothetical protein
MLHTIPLPKVNHEVILNYGGSNYQGIELITTHWRGIMAVVPYINIIFIKSILYI